MSDLAAGFEHGKPITWMGDSRKAISNFPVEIKKELGYGLRQVQMGSSASKSKPMHGDLAEVMELVAGDRTGTYRAAYTVKLAGVVYVLHCFQKKSMTGIKTPEPDLDTIRKRLQSAKSLHRQLQLKASSKKGSR